MMTPEKKTVRVCHCVGGTEEQRQKWLNNHSCEIELTEKEIQAMGKKQKGSGK